MNVNSLSTTGVSLEEEVDELELAALEDEATEEKLLEDELSTDEVLEAVLEVLDSLVVLDVLSTGVSLVVNDDSTLVVDSTVLMDVLSTFVLVLAVELQAIKKATLTSVKTLISFIMMVSFSTLDVLIVLSKHRIHYNE